MSYYFDFYLYFPLDEFERALRELKKVADCGSNREGSITLPDRREFRSRLFNRERICFSEKNKTSDFDVTPVVRILAEETELSEFEELVGPAGKQQGLIRMSADFAFCNLKSWKCCGSSCLTG